MKKPSKKKPRLTLRALQGQIRALKTVNLQRDEELADLRHDLQILEQEMPDLYAVVSQDDLGDQVFDDADFWAAWGRQIDAVESPPKDEPAEIEITEADFVAEEAPPIPESFEEMAAMMDLYEDPASRRAIYLAWASKYSVDPILGGRKISSLD